MPKPLIFTLITLLLAICSTTVWQIEVSTQVGWEGTRWLEYQLLSPFAAVLLSVVAYLLPFKLYGLVLTTKRWVWVGIELYFTLIVAYLIGKIILLSLYTGLLGFMNSYGLWAVMIGVVLLTAASYHLTTRRRLIPVKNALFLILVVGMLAIAPLSWVSAQLISAYRTGEGWVDIFKFGFPYFWLTSVLAIAGWLATHYLQQSEVPATDPTILDDDSF